MHAVPPTPPQRRCPGPPSAPPTTTKGRHRPHLSESSADRRIPRPSPLVPTPRPLRIGGLGLRVAVSKHGSNHDVKGDRASELKPFPDQELPPNLLHTDLARVQAHYGQPDWFQDIVSSDLNRAVLICHGPGMTNEAHWHPAFDEWWPVLKGEVTWEVGSNRPPIHAREGDVVFVPKGMRHLITTVGAGASLRLAVMAPEAVHVYTDDDESAPPPRGLG